MSFTQTHEEKSKLRLSRAMIAAGAAVVVAVSGAAYAFYKLQGVLKGMQENFETTTTLYTNPDDGYLDVNRHEKPSRER